VAEYFRRSSSHHGGEFAVSGTGQSHPAACQHLRVCIRGEAAIGLGGISFGRILQVREKSFVEFELLNAGFRMIGKKREDIGHAVRDCRAVISSGQFAIFVFHTRFLFL
jgi:hypothetical protein